MMRIKIVLLLFVTAVTSVIATYFFFPHKATISVFPWDLKDSKNFACSTKIGGVFFPRQNYGDHTFEKVDGELLTKDSTKMAIQIDGKTLKMITATSVEVGMTEPAQLIIVRENDKELIAVDPESDVLLDKGVGTFVLNKKKGLAVWTKSKPSFFGNEMPEVQAYYMECR